MSALSFAAAACAVSSWPRAVSRSLVAVPSDADSSLTFASSVRFVSCASDSVFASCAICAFRSASAWFLPASVCDSTNWPIANSSSTNIMTMISDDRASTNPGQMSKARRRRAREFMQRHLLLARRHSRASGNPFCFSR